MSRSQTNDDLYYALFRESAYGIKVHGWDIGGVDISATEEQLERLARKISARREEVYREAMFGPPPFRNVVEVITDPSDRRGFNARRIN